jgi:hypothetical protein
MPVPYLENKPDVLPIHIGRQLFVDDFLIAETDLEAVHHTPSYEAQNPVFQPDREWEKTRRGGLYAAPFGDGVWYLEGSPEPERPSRLYHPVEIPSYRRRPLRFQDLTVGNRRKSGKHRRGRPGLIPDGWDKHVP